MDNSQKIDEIKDKLKTIFDPEIPVDIYELGLIYDVRLKDKNCEIDMTLTSPNCPEAQSIPNNVRKVQKISSQNRRQASRGEGVLLI